jgi:hypothetical protein
MQRILIEKLRKYIILNNPDILINLQTDFSFNQYLEEKVHCIQPLLEELLADGKPSYIIEELCLNELTKDLRPSKFNYIQSVFEEEFEQDFLLLKKNNTLTYEIMNLISECEPVFEIFGFTEETEDNRNLHYGVAGTIQQFLDSK